MIVKDFSKFEEKIGLRFKEKDLLVKAFCHRSFLNENPDFKLNHNERLEFLGDAVLELVVTEYLFKKYPGEPEGVLTNWRASLVNTKILVETANELGLNEFLLLSEGEKKEREKKRKHILADTFEALIGAVYLDFGYEECWKFIEKHLLIKLNKIIENGLFRDAKSHFQERSQEETGITPTYEVIKEKGPDHQKHFKIGVFLEDELIAEGEGLSKQEAEEKAAEEALKIKNW